MKKRLSLLSRLKLAMMRMMGRMMPSCKDVSKLVSRSLDERLSLRARISIQMHLAFCKWCRQYYRQLHLIHAAMDWDEKCEFNRPDSTNTLSKEARSRITESLDKHL